MLLLLWVVLIYLIIHDIYIYEVAEHWIANNEPLLQGEVQG